jgi:hypothetical protein
MDFFDFGIYFAAVIVVAVLVFWIVFLLVRSLRPKKQAHKKIRAQVKNASLKRIAQKSQSKTSEPDTEVEFDENDIETPDISDITPKKRQNRQTKVSAATEPETSMAMENTLEKEEPEKTDVKPGEIHSFVSGEGPEQAPPPDPPARRDQKQAGGTKATAELNQIPDSEEDTSEQEESATEEGEQSSSEQPEGATTVPVYDDIGEMTGEPPTVTEAETQENEGEGDIFDVFDTELEEESKLGDFAAGLGDVDLGDLQSLTKDLHAILPARPKSQDTEEAVEK